ncbi:MAG: alpha/beta hydrolase [Acetatifactor sp.]|nr:alpha/beta hydrolase [Acetatifactor sp.]
MMHETFSVQVEGSQPYARLVTYIQEHTDALAIQERPLVLICPGGGYAYTSDREAESIALQFLAMGYHAAVLRYSCAPSRYPTALKELAESILLIREHAQQWHVKADKIVVQGCSAGGHLAASYAMFWNQDWFRERAGVQDRDPEHRLLRPSGLLLCYPVITSGEYAHKGSFENLIGDRPGQQELLEQLSLEKQVSGDVPPAFIWHTYEDQSVPVENSLLLVSALRRAAIPAEFHMYPRGCHGLALATALTQTSDGRCVQQECAGWIDLAHTWMENIL